MLGLLKYAFLLITGGLTYYLLEVIWRGRSHGSMILVAGVCFLLIGFINDLCRKHRIPVFYQIAITVICVTLIEFVSGVYLNLYLGLAVWDYSYMPLNLLGQVCITYVLLWIPVCIAAVVLNNRMRDILFGGNRAGSFRREWKRSGFRIR